MKHVNKPYAKDVFFNGTVVGT